MINLEVQQRQIIINNLGIGCLQLYDEGTGMRVVFKVHPFLRKLLNYQPEAETEGNTLGECIDNLDQKYPGFRQQLIGKNGRFKKNFKLYVNNDSASPQDLHMPVNDGDTVTIITYIAGG